MGGIDAAYADMGGIFAVQRAGIWSAGLQWQCIAVFLHAVNADTLVIGDFPAGQ